jgi:hypothetical protein
MYGDTIMNPTRYCFKEGGEEEESRKYNRGVNFLKIHCIYIYGIFM